MTTRGWRGPAAILLGAASGCFSEHGPSTPSDALTCERAALPPGPDSAFVVVSGFSFAPAELRIAAGTRVVWINCEPAGTPGHTTTAVAGDWDSPTLAPGNVFSIVPAPGDHPYHCRPHPFMQARVIVD